MACRVDEAAHRVTFLISIFTADGDRLRRLEEVHRQRGFEADELTAAARAAGFTILAVTDDYSWLLADERTLRQTWLLRS